MEDQHIESGTEPVEPSEDIQEMANDEQAIQRQGFTFGISTKRDVMIHGGGAFGIAVGRDVQMADSGAASIAVGRDLTMNDSGTVILNTRGSAEMTDSGSVLAACNEATVNNSMVGILISRQTTLVEGSKVLMTTKQALAFGAAFGAVFALLGWLLKRK